MKLYECDACHTQYKAEPKVELRGVASACDILLPESLMSKQFCSPDCFWTWVMGQIQFVKKVGGKEVDEIPDKDLKITVWNNLSITNPVHEAHITHLPTGLTAAGQGSSSAQARNLAMQSLKWALGREVSK